MIDGYFPPDDWNSLEGGYVPQDNDEERARFWEDIFLEPDFPDMDEPDFPDSEPRDEDDPGLSPYDFFGDDEHIVVLDVTKVDLKNLRGQVFVSLEDAILWLLETRLLTIGKPVDFLTGFFGVAVEDTPKKRRKRRSRKGRKRR